MPEIKKSSDDVTVREFFARMHASHLIGILGIIVLIFVSLLSPLFYLGYQLGQNSKLTELITNKSYLIEQNDSLQKTNDSLQSSNVYLKNRAINSSDQTDSLRIMWKPLLGTASEKLTDDQSSLKEKIKIAINPTDFIVSVYSSGDGIINYELKPTFQSNEIKVAFFTEDNLQREMTFLSLTKLKGTFEIPENAKREPKQRYFNFVLKDLENHARWGFANEKVLSAGHNALKNKINIKKFNDIHDPAFKWDN